MNKEIEENRETKPLEVFVDGATYGRNGPLGSVSKIGIGVWIPSWTMEFSFFEDGISNNVAELRAMIKALDILKDYRNPIVLFSDSKLAVGWLNKKKESGKPHIAREQAVLKNFTNQLNVIAEFIPREENTIADRLSKRFEYGQKEQNEDS